MINAPIFEELSIKPSSSVAVITLASGPPGQKLLEVSGKFLSGYASKTGADYHVIAADSDHPLVNKFRLSQYLDFYEKILFFDADVIVDPKTPSLFDYITVDQVALFDEADIVPLDESQKRLYSEIAGSQKIEGVTVDTFYNSGVILAGKNCKKALEPPSNPLPDNHFSEQCLINLNIRRNKIQVRLLPRQFHWIRSLDVSLLGKKDSFVWHFAGASLDDKVNEMNSQVKDLGEQSFVDLAGRILNFEHPSLSLEVSPLDPYRDGTYKYLCVGRSFLNFIRTTQLITGVESFSTILDLNAGFGRTSRWIKAEFPDSHLHAMCMLPTEAEFCAKFADVTTLMDEFPEVANLDSKRYDLVFCNCYLTNVTETYWSSAILRMSNSLSPGGIMVLSCHGNFTYDMVLKHWLFRKPTYYDISPESSERVTTQVKQSGFGYLGGETGFTVAAPSWVMACVNAINPGLKCVHFREMALDNHLDLYAFQRPLRHS